MSQNSNHVPVALDDWRSWITARAQELKHEYPLLSKKDCWRSAQQLRRRQKQGTRKALLSAEQIALAEEEIACADDF